MISSGLIKAIQDIMRQDDGVDGDAQRLSQLVWMIFLKILDDNEQELELLNSNYVPAVPAELQWRSWAANEEGLTGSSLLNFVNNKLFPELRALPINKSNQRTQIVREVFEDSHNYMKNGTLLRQVANKINTIDFNKQDDRHSFNDIYETLLRSLQSAGNSGEYYTPRPVTKFIVEMVDPKFGESILDPACGTGGFLSNAIEHIRQQVKTPEDERLLQDSIRGVEKKQLPHLLCMTNMILHGIEVPLNIRRDNTLKRPLKDYGPTDRVDVVLTNPPFGGTEEPGIESNFPQTYRTRETADLFLVLIMKLLKPGGRAGIVLPDGFLAGEGVKTRIKEHLLNDCNLHTIVRLPRNVFSPYTDIPTNLLFFEKGTPTKEIWYFEHPYPNGQKSYSKTKPIRDSEFDLEKAWWNSRTINSFAWQVSLEDIVKNNYNLDFKNPNKVEEKLNDDPSEVLNQITLNIKAAEELTKALKSELQ
jgi:type I restriction enzyme M protein